MTKIHIHYFLIFIFGIFIVGCSIHENPKYPVTPIPSLIVMENVNASTNSSLTPQILDSDSAQASATIVLPTSKGTPTVFPVRQIYLGKSEITFSAKIFDHVFSKLLDEIAVEGVDLGISGIYALNRQDAYIFGSISHTHSSVQSVVLMTNDGGETWTEVMKPTGNSTVDHLIVLADGKGWATVTVNSEGVQGVILWTTDDFGQNWLQAKSITGLNTYVVGIRFWDDQTGHINVIQEKGRLDDGVILYNTRDGGMSWTEALRINQIGADGNPIDNFREKILDSFFDVPGGRYGSHWDESNADHSSQARGMDGSAWVIRPLESGDYVLEVVSIDDRTTQIHIPGEYQYHDGTIIPVEK